MRHKPLPIKIRIAILFFLIFILFITFYTFPKQKNLKIHFIDVGEGDSILIQTPENHNILIDAGNLVTGFKVTKYLKKLNISSLDYLIFTHPHLDHIGGAFFILQEFKVSRLYDNGQDINNLIASLKSHYWYNELVRKNNKYSQMREGSNLNIDGVVFYVLWPPRNRSYSDDLNSNSLVILVKYKDFKCLLTADIDTTVEGNIINKLKNSKIDVLKISHHGSSNATRSEFLNTISPRLAIISVNKENISGYPSTETLSKLKELNIKTCRTDIDGNIMIEIDKAGKIKLTKRKYL